MTAAVRNDGSDPSESLPFLFITACDGAAATVNGLADVEARRDQVARLEQERADLRSEIDRFQTEYAARVGALQSALESIDLHIAEYRLRLELVRFRRAALDAGQLESEVAWRLREQRDHYTTYQESVSRAERAVRETPAPATIDTQALKSAYRELAKRCHPDLAHDVAERQARSRVMADVNAAYARHDLDALQSLLAQHADRDDRADPHPFAASREELARLDQTILDLRSEIAEMNRSEWLAMKVDAALARARGVDWFAQARSQIEARIAERSHELERLIAEFMTLVREVGLA